MARFAKEVSQAMSNAGSTRIITGGGVVHGSGVCWIWTMKLVLLTSGMVVEGRKLICDLYNFVIHKHKAEINWAGFQVQYFHFQWLRTSKLQIVFFC